MAIKQELYQLLDAADRAGNQQDVEDILSAIRQAEQPSPPPEPQMAPSHSTPKSEPSIADLWEMATPKPQIDVTPEKVSTVMAGAVPFGSEIYSGAKALFGKGKGNNISERYSSNIDKEKTNINRFFKEDPWKASVALGVPALLSGSLITKMAAPKTALGGIGYATGEGALWGSAQADPGLQNRLKAGGIGAAVGAGTGIGLTTAQRLLGSSGKTVGGIKDMLFGEPKETVDKVKDTSRLHIANILRSQDATGEDVMERMGTLSRTGKDPVVADVLDEPYEAWVSEIVASGEPQQQQAKRILKDVLDPRAKKSTLKVEEALQANQQAVKRNIEYKNNLESIRKKVGGSKDDYLVETIGEEIPDAEAVRKFLERGNHQRLLRQATKRLEERGLPVTLGTKNDPNEVVIDRLLFEEMKDILNDNISVAKFAGSKDAHKAEVLTQFKNLMKGKDDVLDNLSSEYHKVRNHQRAYAAGLDDFKKMRNSEVMETLQGMDKWEYNAFRRGVLTDIGDNRSGLFSLLESDTGLLKLTTLLGEETPEKALQALNTAKKQSGTQKAMAQGRRKFAGGARAEQTVKGQLERVTNLFARLAGKRAYSAQGGVFMFGNEVFEILQRTDLSDEVLTQMVKDLGRSGGDAQKFLQHVTKYDIPRVAEARIEDAVRKSLRATQMGGYGASSGALQEQLRKSH